MNQQQFANTFTSLAMIYGKEFTQDQLKVYYSLLRDIELNQFKLACGNIAKKSKFMPTVADIREEVATIQGGDAFRVIPEEEWKKVLYCVRHFGPYKMEQIKEYLGEITYNIASRFGWEDLFNLQTEEVGYQGDRFIKFYQANQKSYKEQLQLNGDFKQLANNLIKRIGDGGNED